MRIAMCLEYEVGPKWHHALQMGVKDAVAIGGCGPVWDYLHMARVKKKFNDFGLNLEVFEGAIPMDRVKLGGEGAAEELEQIVTCIRNMGALGIPVFCYSWMAKYTWIRTSMSKQTRGGALTTAYDDEVSTASPEFNAPPIITQAELWDGLQRFLDRVIPICEQEGVKLAMHPDDPPLQRVFGTERIMNSVENFERLLAYSSSKVNGVTFCQANFAAMGADVPATIRRLGADGRIHFAHFRDIEGDAHHITETFHDAGKTDMFASMQAYYDVGFSGVIRPDHAPVMYGEENERPGYMALGRLFAVGYMKGLMEGVEAGRRQ
jgi:mannonate dehydratase